MSNSGELAAAEAEKRKPRILVVDDQVRIGRTLASVMGTVSGIVSPAMLGACLPRIKAGNRHQPHQGDKERMRRLQKLGHTYHCAARHVWGDGQCECRKAEIVPGTVSKMVIEAAQPVGIAICKMPDWAG